MIRPITIAFLGIMALASAGFGVPLCTGPLTILSLGATGCSVGVVTFSNFALLNPTAGGGAVLPSDTNVLINITFASPNDVLTFTPVTPANWQLGSSNQQWAFTINYTVTAPTAFFHSYQSSVSGSFTGTGNFSLTKNVSTQPATAGADQVNNLSAVIPFVGAPISTFNVSDNIQLSSGTSGTASLTSVRNIFSTPEPLTSILLGSGLLAFGCMTRRRRSS
jgi:hypothetical protein